MSNYRSPIKSYLSYKDSGVEWLGDVPEHWEVGNLKKVAQVIDGDRSSEYPNESDFVSTGIPFLSTANIINNQLDFSKLNFISEEKFQKLRNGKIRKNDLIITVRGTIGATAVFNNNKSQTAFINAQMMIIRPNHKHYSIYFLYYGSLSAFWSKQLDVYAYGTAQKQLNGRIVRNLFIPIPPPEEQKSIAHYLDTKTGQIDRKIDLLTQKATQYGKLKQSLINETVTRGLDKSVLMKDSDYEWDKKNSYILARDKS